MTNTEHRTGDHRSAAPDFYTQAKVNNYTMGQQYTPGQGDIAPWDGGAMAFCHSVQH